MEIVDGFEMSYAWCSQCRVICISNDNAKCHSRAVEHMAAHPGHGTFVEQIGFTAGNLPGIRL